MRSSIPIHEIQQGRLQNDPENSRAFLIGTYHSNKDRKECDEHLAELKSLCATYGFAQAIESPTHQTHIDAATFLSKGKLQELILSATEVDADTVIFDDELSPNQQRNLERAFQRVVIDRTELIIGVFSQRAKTREAKIQVAIAQLQYQMPRLVRMWTHLERQRTGGSTGGGGGYLKGAGEKQLEIDKRILKKQIAKLEEELELVKRHRATQRKLRQRRNLPTFAIIGYTNSGKSTLLHALTDAKVLIEDKLFATLDTTTRRYILPNRQQILLIDTVGFIRKIPHMLVAAFKGTLEEALESDILLHLIDVSNPKAEEQAETTYSVLKELNASNYPIITCLNKIDIRVDQQMLSRLRLKYPNVIELSALNKIGFDELFEKMVREISLLRQIYKLKVPQSYYALVSELIRNGRVISCVYEGDNILLEVEISRQFEKKLTAFLA